MSTDIAVKGAVDKLHVKTDETNELLQKLVAEQQRTNQLLEWLGQVIVGQASTDLTR